MDGSFVVVVFDGKDMLRCYSMWDVDRMVPKTRDSRTVPFIENLRPGCLEKTNSEVEVGCNFTVEVGQNLQISDKKCEVNFSVH